MMLIRRRVTVKVTGVAVSDNIIAPVMRTAFEEADTDNGDGRVWMDKTSTRARWRTTTRWYWGWIPVPRRLKNWLIGRGYA